MGFPASMFMDQRFEMFPRELTVGRAGKRRGRVLLGVMSHLLRT